MKKNIIKIPRTIKEDDDEIVFKEGMELSLEVVWKNFASIFLETDFGMRIQISRIDNMLITNKRTSVNDIVLKTIIFDLFHAFYHPEIDPNYTHYHWALYGNLKDRVEYP